MFTGIIAELGLVEAVEASDEGSRLRDSRRPRVRARDGRLRGGERRLPHDDLDG